LGTPKHLLEYKGSTVLGVTLDMVRACGFDQILVTIGGASVEVRDRVDFRGCEVVENEQFETGCSSSIGAAIGVVDPRADAIVLLLGDQPDVTTQSVRTLLDGARSSSLGVCRYRNGVGHPFWFERHVFDDLLDLHGDKAEWKLLESRRYPVREVEIAGDIPLDVDTWEDYEALLARAAAGSRK